MNLTRFFYVVVLVMMALQVPLWLTVERQKVANSLLSDVRDTTIVPSSEFGSHSPSRSPVFGVSASFQRFGARHTQRQPKMPFIAPRLVEEILSSAKIDEVSGPSTEPKVEIDLSLIRMLQSSAQNVDEQGCAAVIREACRFSPSFGRMHRHMEILVVTDCGDTAAIQLAMSSNPCPQHVSVRAFVFSFLSINNGTSPLPFPYQHRFLHLVLARSKRIYESVVPSFVKQFVRGKVMLFLGPSISTPLLPEEFLNQFFSNSVAAEGAHSKGEHDTFDEIASGLLILGGQVAAAFQGHLYVVSHGIAVARGSGTGRCDDAGADDLGAGALVLFERLSGFSIGDARSRRNSGGIAPSPHCFAVSTEIFTTFWPLVISDQRNESKRVENPVVDFGSLSPLLHSSFFDFVFSARHARPSLRTASCPAVVVGVFPGWSPMIHTESLEQRLGAKPSAEANLLHYTGVHTSIAVRQIGADPDGGANVQRDFPAQFCTRHEHFLYSQLPENSYRHDNHNSSLPAIASRSSADSSTFLRGVAVVWDSFCIQCFGFTNEVMHFVVPLEEQLKLRVNLRNDCFCSGTPRSFSGALSRLFAPKPFEGEFNDKGTKLKHPMESSGMNTVPKSEFNPNQGELLVWISHKDPGSFPTFFPGLRRRPDFVIGRSMYEFTRVPPSWIANEKKVDEIWVPSRYVHWVFRSNGFSSSKLFVMPEPLDVFFYDPLIARPLRLPVRTTPGHHWRHASNVWVVEGPQPRSSLLKAKPMEREVARQRLSQHFKFLSVFKWEERKAWEVLFRAFFGEFRPTEPVSLYIVAYMYGDSSSPRDASRMLQKAAIIAERVLEEQVHTTSDDSPTHSKAYGGIAVPIAADPIDGEMAREKRADSDHQIAVSETLESGMPPLYYMPHIEIVSEELSESDLVNLYASVDSFVLPTRGEGWGLPLIQAMSMALPTIATNWSGNIDFMDSKTSYPIELEELQPVPERSPHIRESESSRQKSGFPEMLWAQPSLSHLRKLMRHVFTHREEAKTVGKAARQHVVKHFSDEAVAELVKSRLAALRDLRWGNARHEDASIKHTENLGGVNALLNEGHLIV